MDVAGTITWDQLRELAGFRAEDGCAVSLYLNLDPRDVPTASDAETHQHSLIDAAERLLDERKGSMGREQREALKTDIESKGAEVEREIREAQATIERDLDARPLRVREHVADGHHAPPR